MSGVKASLVGRTAKSRGSKMCAGLTTEKRLGGQIEDDGAVQRGNESHRAGQVPVVESWEFL